MNAKVTPVAVSVLIVLASSCHRTIEVTFGESTTVMRYVVDDSRCASYGTEVICYIAATRGRGFLNQHTDSATGVEIFLRAKRLDGTVSPQIDGYVIYGGVFPSANRVFEVVDSNLIPPVGGSGSLEGWTRCRQTSQQAGGPRVATITFRDLRVSSSPTVVDELRRRFVIDTVPALADWLPAQ
jgi:hypothetical protein